MYEGGEENLELAARLMIDCLRGGGTIFACGNGGSAEQADHFVAELVGRFEKERGPYRAISLTMNPAVMTAIANDYGYEHVFSRPLAALGRRGDVLLALSTSGMSDNVWRAARHAKSEGITVVGMTGMSPKTWGAPLEQKHLSDIADICFCAPETATSRIQETHLRWVHSICRRIENEVTPLTHQQHQPEARHGEITQERTRPHQGENREEENHQETRRDEGQAKTLTVREVTDSGRLKEWEEAIAKEGYDPKDFWYFEAARQDETIVYAASYRKAPAVREKTDPIEVGRYTREQALRHFSRYASAFWAGGCDGRRLFTVGHTEGHRI